MLADFGEEHVTIFAQGLVDFTDEELACYLRALITKYDANSGMLEYLIDHCRVMQLGDDSTIGTKEPIFDEVLKRLYVLAGHDADVTCHGTNYNAVDFCSGYFWQVSPGRYVLGPKVGRALSRSFLAPSVEYASREVKRGMRNADFTSAMVVSETTKNVVEEWMYRVAYGYRNYLFVPVFGQIIAQILVHGSKLYGGDIVGYVSDNPHKVQLEVEVTSVDHNLLQQQFAAIYGISSEAFTDLLRINWYEAGQFLFLDENFHKLAEVDGFAASDTRLGSYVPYYHGAKLVFQVRESERKAGVFGTLRNFTRDVASVVSSVRFLFH